MDRDIELRRLVGKAWEETCLKFVPGGNYAEKQLQSFLFDELAEIRGSQRGIEREYPYKGKRIDLAIDNRVFMELELHLKSGIRTPGQWRMRIRRHTEPSLEKLDEIKKERLGALCYYGIYAYSHRDDDDFWWQKINTMCNEKRVEFLCCAGSLWKWKCPFEKTKVGAERG